MTRVKRVYCVSAYFMGNTPCDAHKTFATMREAKAYYKAWMAKVVAKRGGKFIPWDDKMLTWHIKGSGMRACYDGLTIQGYLSAEREDEMTAPLGHVEMWGWDAEGHWVRTR